MLINRALEILKSESVRPMMMSSVDDDDIINKPISKVKI